jgi:hypothetical protein
MFEAASRRMTTTTTHRILDSLDCLWFSIDARDLVSTIIWK